MLRYHLDDVFIVFVIALLIVVVISIYTFYANRYRSVDDPKKGDYNPWGILLIPLAAPFFFSLAIATFILTVVLYTGFLIFFMISLVVIRKWFIFTWWHKFATAVGDPLLKMNTSLFRKSLKP